MYKSAFFYLHPLKRSEQQCHYIRQPGLAEKASTKRVKNELPANEHTKLKLFTTQQGKTIKELLTEDVAGRL